MDNQLIQILLMALTTAYLTHILILERKTSHFGPFPSKGLVVLFKPDEEFDEEHIQPVTLFDWVRRIFGVYSVKNHVWTVKAIESQRWTCPICLSFWIAAAVIVINALLPDPAAQQVLLLFSLSCISSVVNVELL